MSRGAVLVCLSVAFAACGGRVINDQATKDAALADTNVVRDAAVAEDTRHTADVAPEVEEVEARPRPIIDEISTSGTMTCAREASGATWCWGVTGSTRIPVPTRIKLDDAQSLSVGWYGRLALTSSGRVFAWGHGYFEGGQSNVVDPEPLPITGTLKSVAQGADFHCVLHGGGGVVCWGDNQLNQIGIPRPPGGYELRPVAIAGVTSVVAIAAGDNHACARTEDNAVTCWGHNLTGATGKPDRSFEPYRVPGVTGVAQVTAGGTHTCVRLLDGTVTCWGGNEYGQLGDGTMLDRPTPSTVAGLTGAKSVVAGGQQTCAITADDEVVCWGGMAGHSGAGSPPPLGRTRPTRIDGLSAIRAIGVANDYLCALDAYGRVRCLGQNWGNQLGNGTTTASATPVEPKF